MKLTFQMHNEPVFDQHGYIIGYDEIVEHCIDIPQGLTQEEKEEFIIRTVDPENCYNLTIVD